jgi:hypothetical protein
MDVLRHLNHTTEPALSMVRTARVPARPSDAGTSPMRKPMIPGLIGVVPTAVQTVIGVAPSLSGPPSAHDAAG